MTLAKVLPFRRPAGRKRTSEAPNGAVDALRRAQTWQAEIDGGASRAQIARREGLSRARVTQLMKLLDLPGHLQEALATGRTHMSTRQAVRLAASSSARADRRRSGLGG